MVDDALGMELEVMDSSKENSTVKEDRELGVVDSDCEADVADSECNDRDLVGVGFGLRREVANVVDIMIRDRGRGCRVGGRSTCGVRMCRCRPI